MGEGSQVTRGGTALSQQEALLSGVAKKMELMQLAMFVAVVEEGSVRRAADRVYRTQPAVSISVRKLEAELEGPLFDRSKRYDFRLTQAGEALYRYAKRILSLQEDATAELNDIRKLRLNRLRVGANESVSLHFLPLLSQIILKCHPDAQVKVTCEQSERLVADLKTRKLDVALVSFRPSDVDLESLFVLLDKLVLIAHPKHILVKKTNVEFGDLGGEPLLMMNVSQHSPWRNSVMDGFIRSNTLCRPQIENAPIESIKKMVSIGLGIGFVPLLSVRQEVSRGELAILDLKGFQEERSVWLVRRWGLHSQFSEEFARTCVTCAEEIQRSDALPNRTEKKRHQVFANRSNQIGIIKRTTRNCSS